MCHVSMAFLKPLQYIDPNHAPFYLNTIQICEVHRGYHPEKHYLWPSSFAVVLSTYKHRGKYSLNLFQLSWSFWQLCSSIQTTIFFSFTTPHTCSKFTHGPTYLKDHLYCICTCLSEVSNIPYVWRYPLLPFLIPQKGSAAAQSNPRAYDTSWLSEEPPPSPQHLCLVQQLVQQNCSLLSQRGAVQAVLPAFAAPYCGSDSSQAWREHSQNSTDKRKSVQWDLGSGTVLEYRNHPTVPMEKPQDTTSLQDFSRRLDLLSFFLSMSLISFPDHSKRWVLESCFFT